jgi:alpha-L-fucosidase
VGRALAQRAISAVFLYAAANRCRRRSSSKRKASPKAEADEWSRGLKKSAVWRPPQAAYNYSGWCSMDMTLFSSGPSAEIDATPSYLADYRELYREDGRAAGVQWFRDARYGLFLHYGLYSLLGRHEWVQFREKISVAEYEKLKERFTAENFDAMAIVEFAISCGMRYINITTRHHDGFCLFNSRCTDFTSAHAPAGRDLIAELAVACEWHGIGLCLYYSHGRDWRHPHAPNNDEWGGNARPKFEVPEPVYARGDEHDLEQYLAFMQQQIHELLTGYGPIAAIWLDGIAVPLSGDREKFHCQDLYDMIHSLQPQVLVSYKQGLLGTEDFFAPEHRVPADADSPAAGKHDKPMEICTTMAPGSWGYMESAKGKHLSEDQLWEKLEDAAAQGVNLLLNTGPLPDGAVDPEDAAVMLKVGERIEREGLPGEPAQ